jgi:hypothetical protein
MTVVGVEWRAEFILSFGPITAPPQLVDAPRLPPPASLDGSFFTEPWPARAPPRPLTPHLDAPTAAPVPDTFLPMRTRRWSRRP